MNLNEDHHVHSIFSDGKATVEQNIERAAALGLTFLACVDHVRESTDWLPAFSKHVRQVPKPDTLSLVLGVETKIRNTAGDLDLPHVLNGIDRIYAADHQFPLPDGCHPARDVKRFIAERVYSEVNLLELLVEATSNVMLRNPGVVVAHLFSVLPKVGLLEDSVPETLLAGLAETARKTGAIIEVDERWECPSVRTAEYFATAGVTIVASSDSHETETLGNYRHVRRVAEALAKRQGA